MRGTLTARSIAPRSAVVLSTASDATS